MRWNRREYLDLLLRRNTENQMFTELFGPLKQLEKEWRDAGVSEEEIGLTAFNFDFVESLHIGNTDIYGGQPPVILEENDEYIISRDALGRREKLIKASASIPLPLDHPVKTMDDWLKIKHLYEFNEQRITQDVLVNARRKQDEGTLICVNIPGGFDMPRQLLGEELICFAYYDEPEMIIDMLNTAADTSIKVFERIADKVSIDLLHVHEDMAGKNAPLVGPQLFNKYITPYYKKVWDFVSQTGCQVFSQDSDGNMDVLLDIMIESGINQTYPLEPAAGMDMVKVREKYGNKLILKGGIDKHALRKDQNAILRELEYKLQPSMKTGGVVFALDHRIPNGVTIENYRFYVKAAQEILGRPQANGGNYDWKRMAF